MALNDGLRRAQRPFALDAIEAAAAASGFAMSCDDRVGNLLALLAATKHRGRFLELGTGYGASAAWLLLGMDDESELLSVDVSKPGQDIAREHLGDGDRLELIEMDAGDFLDSGWMVQPFDLIFADCRPGKFDGLGRALKALKRGGIYIGDDLLPQPTWPEDHQPRVDGFIRELHALPPDEFRYSLLDWASGLVLITRV